MFNEKIKELRLANSLNQVQFASKIGVTKQCVSNWENNNIQPSIDMLMRIANVFSVSVDYILGLDKRSTIDVTGLTPEQVYHIQSIVDYIRK